MKPALVILAAGMGSRYGGLKQLDPVGPSGEALLEYSVYDALRAGFGKIIFVIRKDFENEFRQQVSSKFTGHAEMEHVYQEVDDLPDGYEQSATGREKPWGTAHAVYAARKVVDGSFGVINADDFYGRSAYEKLAEFLRKKVEGEIPSWCLVGYLLKNTLSEHGTVSRALCEIDGEGNLKKLKEHTGIKEDDNGRIHGINKGGVTCSFESDETVSMNCFGFTLEIFSIIEEGLRYFLDRQSGGGKAEIYLPEVAGEAVNSGKAQLKVLSTDEQWHGLTYKEDLRSLRGKIGQLVKFGQYPENLWTRSG